ncbi:MAG: hypothetical protein DRP56_08060 [Planctomycetota bacterium]|nr:MAG: hypothetical protein DRP56_08060 [Planctomycetota bacterium]
MVNRNYTHNFWRLGWGVIVSQMGGVGQALLGRVLVLYLAWHKSLFYRFSCNKKGTAARPSLLIFC